MRHQNISYGRQIIFAFAFCSSKTKPQVAESLLIKSNSCWNCWETSGLKTFHLKPPFKVYKANFSESAEKISLISFFSFELELQLTKIYHTSPPPPFFSVFVAYVIRNVSSASSWDFFFIYFFIYFFFNICKAWSVALLVV